VSVTVFPVETEVVTSKLVLASTLAMATPTVSFPPTSTDEEDVFDVVSEYVRLAVLGESLYLPAGEAAAANVVVPSGATL
jgi:hypothetical protein